MSSATLRVASYNVLADGYIKPEYYPNVAPALFERSSRHPAVVRRAAGLGADVLCLQEVDPRVLALVRGALPELHVQWMPKPGRQDGVATFTRADPLEHRVVHFADETARLALLTVIEHDGRRLGVANTHLKHDASIGLAQAGELADALAAFEPACDAWLLCGDLNAPPDAAIVDRFCAAGFRDSHSGRAEFTSNFAAGCRRIDYVLGSPELELFPVPLPAMTRETALPSQEEPSDHVPIQALVRFGRRLRERPRCG